MNAQLFSHITCDYYTRQYELNPQFTDGVQVIVYAECSANKTGVNGHYYALDLFFSADGIPIRNHIIGVSFGAGQMDKPHIDAEIDRWVNQIVREDNFHMNVKDYMRKEEMWEDIVTNENMNDQDTAE